MAFEREPADSLILVCCDSMYMSLPIIFVAGVIIATLAIWAVYVPSGKPTLPPHQACNNTFLLYPPEYVQPQECTTRFNYFDDDGDRYVITALATNVLNETHQYTTQSEQIKGFTHVWLEPGAGVPDMFGLRLVVSITMLLFGIVTAVVSVVIAPQAAREMKPLRLGILVVVGILNILAVTMVIIYIILLCYWSAPYSEADRVICNGVVYARAGPFDQYLDCNNTSAYVGDQYSQLVMADGHDYFELSDTDSWLLPEPSGHRDQLLITVNCILYVGLVLLMIGCLLEYRDHKRTQTADTQ